MRRGRPLVALGIVVLAVTVAGPPAPAVFPYGSAPGPTGVYDYGSYLFVRDGDCETTPNDLPDDFDCTGDWKFTDTRDTSDPLVALSAQELYGVRGTGTNRAWEVSTGRPDVVIAVLDSGMRWEEPSLRRKHFINRGELPVPAGGPSAADVRFGGYDVDANGAFNISDYGGDARATDRNGNGSLDPEDLILTFSDGVDGDGNGYVDDISGWDFFENDNDPRDDVDYGHGTGEAEDSGGEAGSGADGQCPNCMVMTLRVGDSFIADVNHFAEAVVYAVDNGASVVQEALGTLNHTSFGRSAVDYAYRNGVIVNASEADEAAAHHNWPAAYDHTMVVNSIRNASLPTTRPASYLYLNGCTNFGGYTYVSIPSTSCSSEATGRSAGVSGLLQSAARNAVERGHMTPYVRDDGTEAAFALSAEEAMQLWRLAADDVDFSTPCPGHAFCDDAPPGVPAPTSLPNAYHTTVPGSTRYQTVRGWDYFTGYGRSNAARLLRFVGLEDVAGVEDREYVPPGPYGVGTTELTAQDRMPPEADITWPRRWHQYAHDSGAQLLLPDDPARPGEIVVRGRAAANRVTRAGGTFSYVLEWAPHAQGAGFPNAGDAAAGSLETSAGPWTTVVEVAGLTSAVDGELGRIRVADVAGALAATPNPFTPAGDPTSEFQPERFSVRLRLRVIADPANASDDVNNEAVSQKPVDVYPADETVVRDDIGAAHETGEGAADALNADGLGRASGGAGSPSFHDLDGDGRDELLLTTEDGVVHAFTDVGTGAELPGWPVHTDRYPGIRTSGDNAYTRGEVTRDVWGSILLGSPAAADLDDDGTLEVVVGDLEGRLYVWEHDGTRRPGFPVTVDFTLSRQAACGPATIPRCDDFEPGPRRRNAFNDRDWGINSAPAVGDLDPAAPGLEIVVGANDAHVYAWHADGSAVEGWPVILRDPAKVASMDPVTRFITYRADAGADIGSKVLVTPSLGDLDGDGSLDVVIGVNEQYRETPNVAVDADPVAAAIGRATGGNTRLYALRATGAASAESPATRATAHAHDQAYLPGWPARLAMLSTDVLPYVGAGTNSQAALADVDADGSLEVVAASIAGPGYVLRHDGSSFYGSGLGGDRTLASAPPGAGSAVSQAVVAVGGGHGSLASIAAELVHVGGSVVPDSPSYIAVGGLAVGSLDAGGHVSVAGPGAGLRRTADILLEADQSGAEDHLGVWDARTGRYEPHAPLVVNDLQFFASPILADVTGDGLAEVVQGTAMSDVVSAGIADSNLEARRRFTGGWHVASAAVGSHGRDSLLLAHVTREGYLRVEATGVRDGTRPSCVALAQWPEYGHDARNTGNLSADAERPGPLRDATARRVGGATLLRFRAPGDDRFCGRVHHYEVRAARGDAWGAGVQIAMVDASAPAGAVEVARLPVADEPVLLVRAFDEAGNGSAPATVVLG